MRKASFSPTQHSQNKVQDEERAEDHQGDKVHPGHLQSRRIIHLRGRDRETEGEERQWRRIQNEEIEEEKPTDAGA